MEVSSKINQENKIEKPKIKEGVNFVFEQNPELEQIGTKEKYSEYLDNIFPESKVKDIVYHRTKNKNYDSILRNGFDLDKSGENLGYTGRVVYFATSIEGAKSFAGNEATVSALVNLDSQYLDKDGNLNKNGLDIIKQELIKSGELYFFSHSLEELNEAIELNNTSTYYVSPNDFRITTETDKLKNYLVTHSENSEDLFNKIRLNLLIKGMKRNPYIIDILDTNQIHILGSEQDIEGFKKFVEDSRDLQD